MHQPRSRLFCRRNGTLTLQALAAALLVMGTSLAPAAAGPPPQAASLLQVQYRPDGYPQDPYRQPPPGYDDPRNGQDPYRQPPRGYNDQPDRYGQDRRRQDDRGDRYGQGGGGRGGSYQQSCSEIRQNGSTLSAICGDGRGRRVESSIDVNRCGRGDIGNSRGYLQCGNIRGNGRPVD